MKRRSREEKLLEIIEKDIPDEIGFNGEEYFFAGWKFEYGIDAGKDFSLAVKAYELAFHKGYSKATKALGDIYKKNADLEKAYKWYLEGCLQEKPDSNSVFGLAMMYHEGEYVSQNYYKARTYFELAYEEGNCKSAYYLGMYYENGIAVAKDQHKALEYYTSGADRFEDTCRDAVKRIRRYINE